MSSNFFGLLMALLKARKDRAVATSSRVHGEWHRARGFKAQLDEYACEYETQFLSAARKSDSVRHLQAQMDFGRRLRDTAHAQEPELLALSQRAVAAKQHALLETERYKTVQQFHRRQRQNAIRDQERRDQKEIEELIQVRFRSL